MKLIEWELSCPMHTDRWREMKKLIVAFLQFANAPKIKGISFPS